MFVPRTAICRGACNPRSCERWRGAFLSDIPKTYSPCAVAFVSLLPLDSGYDEHSARISKTPLFSPTFVAVIVVPIEKVCQIYENGFRANK